MTKLILYIFSLLIFLTIPLLSQEQNINLKIISKDNNNTLENANVSLYQLNETKLKKVFSGMTDKTGVFSLQLPLPIILEVRKTGYKPYYDTLYTAGDYTISIEELSYQTEQIVVTAQFAPLSADRSLFKVRVIDQEIISTKAAPSLRELLNSELNIRLAQDNILGSSLNIQGITGQNVKIMIDGVPVVGRLDGNIDLSQLMLNNAERIEIIEGPVSTVYGTDALGGVINIITKNNTGQNLGFTINSLYESVGNYNLDGTINLGLGYKSSLSLSGGRYFFEGFSAQETNSRFQQWKPREQYFGDVQLVIPFNKYNLRYTGRYFNEFIYNRGVPRSPYYETAFDDKYFTDRLTNSLFFDGKPKGDDYLNLTLAHSYYKRQKNTFFKNLVTLEEQITSDPNDQDTSYINSFILRAFYGTAKETKLNYQAGIDFNLEFADGRRILHQKQEIGDYATFLSVKYNALDFLTLQPAVRFIYNTRYTAPIVPSINMMLNIIPSSLDLRFSYARGFRSPSIKEIAFYFVDINHNIQGNENLDAETSDNYNISLTWQKQNNTSIIKIEPTVFYNDIRNLITLANIDETLYSYTNIGKYKTLGSSLNTSYLSEPLRVSVGFSYIGRYSNIGKQFKDEEFLFSPEFNTTINWLIPSTQLQLSLFYKYTGKINSYFIIDTVIAQREIQPYHTLDMSLNYSFFNKALTLTAGAKNIFDVTNIDAVLRNAGETAVNMGSLPVGWGRTFFLSLKYNFRGKY